MDEKEEVPPPNPQPDFGVSAQSNAGDKEERLYIREGYQNLLRVLELLDKKFPVPVSQKQIQDTLELSKSIVFDICWNLCFRSWAENMGEGRIRRRFDTSDNDARLGREVKKLVELACGVILSDKRKD